MKFARPLALGRAQTRGPGQAPGAIMAITPAFIDGVATGGGPEWLPEGADWHAHFADEHYWNGAECAVTDMFVSDDVDGDPFDPDAITPGVGYAGNHGGMLTGPLALSARPQTTIVLDLVVNFTGGNNYVVAYDHGDYLTWWEVEIGTGSGSGDVDHRLLAAGTTGGQVEAGLAHYGVGSHKAALTLDGAGRKLSISVDGGAVVTLAPSDWGGDIWAALTFWITASTTLVSITGYPSVDDADLPALSAL